MSACCVCTCPLTALCNKGDQLTTFHCRPNHKVPRQLACMYPCMRMPRQHAHISLPKGSAHAHTCIATSTTFGYSQGSSTFNCHRTKANSSWLWLRHTAVTNTSDAPAVSIATVLCRLDTCVTHRYRCQPVPIKPKANKPTMELEAVITVPKPSYPPTPLDVQ